MPTKKLLIRGEVQGVFYRASAKEVAIQLGITGWIRNIANGNVEAKISGDESTVEKFIAWCRVGPPKADVIEVIISDELDEYHENFQVLR